MSSNEWFRWPTNSTDPAVNAAVAVMLAMMVAIAIVAGITILLPVAILIGIGKGVHWYVNRPVPTGQIYAVTEQRSRTANFPAPEAFLDAYLDRFIEATTDDPPAWPIVNALAQIADRLYREENLGNPLPPLPPANSIEEGRYRDQLIAHQRKTADAPQTLDLLHRTIGRSFLTFVDDLPAIAKSTSEDLAKCGDDQPFATFPLIDMIPDAAKAVWNLMLPFLAEEVDQIGLFAALRKQLFRNYNEAAGGKSITPETFKGTPRDLVSAYFDNTPLEDLFYVPIPFRLTDRQRFEHMHVIGGSGHGKTQLLQRLIVDDLNREHPPSLIIVDSQGEMLRKIQRVAVFAPGAPLSERLIVIDPEDVEYPPALNMFDMQPERLGGYSQTLKEQIEASTIEIFNYVFGALAAELTSRQNTTFAFVTRLLLSIPGATIHTLRELFEDGALSIDASPFAEHIRKLDPTSQAYFHNQFFTKPYSPTRQSIARRLYSVMQVPAFERMFAAPTNTLDMFAAMQAGSIVLINTSKALLKNDASALFGRYMIARVISAAFERIAVPAAERNPAFLIVDEAADYFDDNLETLLSQARKYNVGVLFAHQHLDQLTPALRASVAANTSIKLAGGISDKDARALASDMRTSADFIAGISKGPHATAFACYVRNLTANAVRLEIPFGALESAATMSDVQHAELIAGNRRRYAVRRDPSALAATATDLSPAAATAPDTPRRTETTASPIVGDDWRS